MWRIIRTYAQYSRHVASQQIKKTTNNNIIRNIYSNTTNKFNKIINSKNNWFGTGDLIYTRVVLSGSLLGLTIGIGSYTTNIDQNINSLDILKHVIYGSTIGFIACCPFLIGQAPVFLFCQCGFTFLMCLHIDYNLLDICNYKHYWNMH